MFQILYISNEDHDDGAHYGSTTTRRKTVTKNVRLVILPGARRQIIPPVEAARRGRHLETYAAGEDAPRLAAANLETWD